jgi:hypothetical protein
MQYLPTGARSQEKVMRITSGYFLFQFHTSLKRKLALNENVSAVHHDVLFSAINHLTIYIS